MATGLVSALTLQLTHPVSWTVIAEFRPAFLATDTLGFESQLSHPNLKAFPATGSRHPGNRPKVAAAAPQSTTVGLALCRSPADRVLG